MRLTTLEEFVGAEAAFSSVFACASDIEPFQASVEARLLLSPTRGFGLSEKHFAAVAAGAAASGVHRAFFAGWSGDDGAWGATHGHRHVDLGSYGSYLAGADCSSIGQFLFAPRGEWGIVASALDYALIGGSATFVDEIAARLDYDADAELERFLVTWHELADVGACVDWLTPLVNHLVAGERPSPRVRR
jgi:hypothetical protein